MIDQSPAYLRYPASRHRVHRLGPMRFGLLNDSFPTMEHAWRATAGDLAAAGLDARTTTEVIRAQQEIDPDA